VSTPKGIIDPWRKAKEAAAAANTPPPPATVHDAPLHEVPTLFGALRGQRYDVQVAYLPVKTQSSDALIGDNLGRCLRALLATEPTAAPTLAKHAVGTSGVVGPKVTFAFGPVTLYAAASSRDPELATRLAVDRLGAALLELSGRTAAARAILAAHEVSVIQKG